MSDGATAELPRSTEIGIALDAERLLASPLGVTVLGAEISADVYIRNGFRFLALPAWADTSDLETASALLRSRVKLGGEKIAQGQSIRLGYDNLDLSLSVNDCVERLRNPRHRLLCEVFWPHVSGELFAVIKEERHLASPHIINKLSETVQKSSGQTRMLARHALALSLHNKALWDEISHIRKGQEWKRQTWERALTWWGHVIRDDAFWSYIQERVQQLDHIQIRPGDVDEMRQKLPQALLGFNSVLARNYGQVARRNSAIPGVRAFGRLCYEHLGLINSCPHPVETKRGAIAGVVNGLVTTGLDPILEQIRENIENAKGRLSHEEFVKRFDPLVQGVLDLRDYLRSDVGLTDKMLQVAEFDRFCEAAVNCINSKVEYSGDKREHALLHGVLACRRLLTLPVSGSIKLRLEHIVNEHRGHLYPDLDLSREFDVCRCFFLRGQEADPAQSLLLPVYKVSDVRGGRVRWTRRNVLVPRSTLAAQFHRGVVSATDLERLASKENAPLISQIQVLNGDERNMIAERSRLLETELDRIRDSFDRQLLEFNRQSSTEERRAQELIGEHQKARDLQLAQEEQVFTAEWAAMQQQFTQQKEPLESEWELRRSASGGWGSVFMLEAPISGAVLSILSVAAYFMVPGLSGRLSQLTQIAALSGMAMGIVAGGARRYHTVQMLRGPLTALETEIREREGYAQSKHAAAVQEIGREFTRKIDAARIAIAGIAQARADIESGKEGALKQARDAAARHIAAGRDAIRKKRKPLEDRVRASVEVRPESHKTRFIPYERYRSQGFKDGTEPSDAEAQALVEERVKSAISRLTPLDSQLLQMARSQMTDERFQQFLIDFLDTRM
jgi:hypothetical protein